MRTIEQIAEKYSYYNPGDMKKFYKEVKTEGYDVSGITHNSNYGGYGIAVSKLQVWINGDTSNPYYEDDETLMVTVEINWG